MNCIALSPSLADSELFGHRHGSFTGATEDHRGIFRSADRGVLFLDEIADLEMALQGKLLRVLQDGRVRAVGEDRELTVNARIVAATNRDIRLLIAEGRFRSDLFHRLSVLEIRVPPLSERREDIGLLIAHFVEKHAALRSKRSPVHAGFVETLERSALPGNVRQLENLVRRALAVRTDDTPLSVEDLPPDVGGDPVCGFDRTPVAGRDPQAQAVNANPDRLPRARGEWSAFLAAADWSLSRSLRACERLLLQAALDQAQGNRTKAARLLGVTPRTVYTKLRRHALKRCY